MAQFLYENSKNTSMLIHNEMVGRTEKVARLNLISSGLTLLVAVRLFSGFSLNKRITFAGHQLLTAQSFRQTRVKNNSSYLWQGCPIKKLV